MAHPFAGHKDHHVSHRRVGKMLSGKEGHVKHHSEGDAFSKPSGKSAAGHVAQKIGGGKSGHRLDKFARGGKVKSKGSQTNIIVVPHHSPPGAAGLQAGPASPPAPRAGPAAPPMPGGMPGGMPGMPPGMPMRARGGKVAGGKRDMKGDFIPGESNPENLRSWASYASRNSFKSGGAVHSYPKMSAGSATGVGRLEESHDQKSRRGK